MVILQPFLLGFELVHRDFMTKTILPRYMIFNIYIYIYIYEIKYFKKLEGGCVIVQPHSSSAAT
jgi:hypothetical protein